ncbi:lipase member M-like [Paroedura picta]|uniref:lipase member M-like n=1 Tax=Paroedura picta TaxID=143630 RepID=UPI004056EAFF
MLLVLFAMCCLHATMDAQGFHQDGKNMSKILTSTKELILYHGYPCEEHDVVTQDGYILSIFRIPHGRKENASTSLKPAVFLQHGMLGEASNWIGISPKDSLGFVLADNGCDVWLGNSRGTQWAKNHVSLSTEDENFWAFSFDQMARYDLPATIDFILQKTEQQQLFYVGHSQGSTIGFIAFSTMPDLARKIKINFALAPVVSVKHTISPLRELFTLPEFLYKIMLGTKEVKLQSRVSPVRSGFCSFFTHSRICYNIMHNLFGSKQKTPNTNQVDEYEVQYLASTSVRNLMHWSQVLKSGQLQAYDYGTQGNLERYKMTRPPEYNVTDMNVATAVWSVGIDGFAGPEDIALLLPQIRNLIYHKFIPEWNHDSLIFDLNTYDQLHSVIVNMIKGSS